MKKLFILAALAIAALAAAPAHASATNAYVTPTGTATGNCPTGTGTAPNFTPAQFSTAANWGAGTGQIGPGTAVLICGTITGAAGGVVLTFQGSGASGNRISLTFDTGASLQAPYFSTNGAIYLNGQSHLLIDGGTDGSISCTANGTVLANQQATKGIYSSFNATDVEIKNLTITNLYVRTTTSDENAGSFNTFGIYFDSGSDLISVHGNTINMMRSTFFLAYSTLTSLQMYDNTLDYSSWQIIVGDSNTNSSASGIQIYGNQMGPHFQLWQDDAQTVHGDGIFIFATQTGSTITNTLINGNYIHGDMGTTGGNSTAYIFAQGTVQSTNITNNVLSEDDAITTGPGIEGLLRLSDSGDQQNISVYNNTFANLGGSGGVYGATLGDGNTVPSGETYTFKNNIFFDSLNTAFVAKPTSFSSLTSNNNDFFGITNVAIQGAFSGSLTTYTTLPNWQAASYAQDAASIATDPALNASYVPLAASSVYHAGTNLTSLAIPMLDTSANGILRAATGGWTIGANDAVPPAAGGFVPIVTQLVRPRWLH